MFACTYRILTISLLFLLLSFPSFGQKKKKTAKPAADTAVTLIHEQYRGNMVHGNDTVPSLLELDHRPKQDSGNFTLVEMIKEPDGRKLPYNTMGYWETQTQQVNNEDNAPVLTLNGAGLEFQIFLERKNDSTLQKLSATYSEMQPASIYTLRKITEKPPSKDSLTERDNTMLRLAGNYKGTLPCADCGSVISSLTLRFKKHSRYGDYTLVEKYTGTPTGDITNKRTGKWAYTSKLIEADHRSLIIILDPDLRGREAYYYVKKEGIIQIDNTMHRTSMPGDRTLRRL